MNEKRWIFHVGMPKTGSSYLQSLFATNAETFASYGIDYSHPNKGLLDKARRGTSLRGTSIRKIRSSIGSIGEGKLRNGFGFQ
jgi:hypothetical protein